MQGLHRQKAFTLIELLVTILIIVITLSMVQLSVGSDKINRKIKQESERLVTLIQFASDEAVMMGKEMGVYLFDNRYQFYQFTESGWVPYQNGGIYRERMLPDGVSFRLYQEGLEVKLFDELPELDEGEELRPQIFLLSSGERSPFELELGIEDGYQIILKSLIYGDIEIDGVQADEV